MGKIKDMACGRLIYQDPTWDGIDKVGQDTPYLNGRLPRRLIGVYGNYSVPSIQTGC